MLLFDVFLGLVRVECSGPYSTPIIRELLDIPYPIKETGLAGHLAYSGSEKLGISD